MGISLLLLCGKKIKYCHAVVLIEVKACSCVASAILYIMEKNCCFNKTIFFEEKCSLPTDTFPGILPSIRQVERAHMIKMQIYRVQCRIHSHDSVFTALVSIFICKSHNHFWSATTRRKT